MLNGRALPINDLPKNIRIRNFDDNTCALEIESFDASLCGAFTAIATNVYGAVHSTALVEISDDGMMYNAAYSELILQENETLRHISSLSRNQRSMR
jgi:hypothetical protein